MTSQLSDLTLTVKKMVNCSHYIAFVWQIHSGESTMGLARADLFSLAKSEKSTNSIATQIKYYIILYLVSELINDLNTLLNERLTFCGFHAVLLGT